MHCLTTSKSPLHKTFDVLAMAAPLGQLACLCAHHSILRNVHWSKGKYRLQNEYVTPNACGVVGVVSGPLLCLF